MTNQLRNWKYAAMKKQNQIIRL